MPTGYNEGVINGRVSDLADYLLLCARAMGPLIRLRDDPDAEISLAIFDTGPSYYATSLGRALNEQARLASMNEADFYKELLNRNVEAFIRHRQSVAEAEDQRSRCVAMIEKVNAWEPPSIHHTDLKRFMLHQLEEEIPYLDRRIAAPLPEFPETSAEAFRISEETANKRDIAYAIEQIEKETARVEFCKEWVKALLDSVAAL